ncbi:Dimethylnonatriene synthase [Frankliniella fusca]|uniref:Dimethylnonatriene synthase n=1 Tax=Frankliniella fusca TaxID=407009 RepID=A0AAE1HES1_9NEOP|nr:Dimethylnonatriene synthase [Frankliniella fusca]
MPKNTVLNREFVVSPDLLLKLRAVNIYFVTIYLKSWYSATFSITAPRRDLELLKETANFTSVNKEVAIATKREVEKNLEKKCAKKKREYRFIPPRDLSSVLEANMALFVNEKTKEFFEIIGVDTDFLHQDPSVWPSLQSFNAAKTVVENLSVVNDCAERAVAIVKDFNNSITKQENDFQNLLMVVKQERSENGDDSSKKPKIKSEKDDG